MEEYRAKLTEAVEHIRSVINMNPVIGIILGSGLGSLTDSLEKAIEIEYGNIPGFPKTTVEGHAGKLAGGKLAGKKVLVMKGRFHYYEGYDISQVVFNIRVFRLLGIKNLLITNSAGGINNAFAPGDLMLIKDHIGLFAPSPLRGMNMDEFGPRFPDMCAAYDGHLRDIARICAEEEGIDIKEGVYAFSQGPMYETPAEVKMLHMLGADAVGMSTVPEVVTARHSGMRVLGISCITNMAAGLQDQNLGHDEVMESARKAGQSFSSLIKRTIERWEV